MKKRFFALCLFLLSITLILTVSAAELPRLADGAGLLTDAEIASVSAKLDEISSRRKVDVVVVTVEETGDRTIETAADDCFEAGYGFGDDRSCILLYVCMNSREWHITTAGYALTTVSDSDLDTIADTFLPHLSEGAYAAAFTAFADICDELIGEARDGEEFNPVFSLAVSLIVGFIFASICVSVMKGKLKTVHYRRNAADYVKSNSMNLRISNDLFLYKTVSRRVKSDDTKNKTTTHKTSSGTTVGGKSGKF